MQNFFASRKVPLLALNYVHFVQMKVAPRVQKSRQNRQSIKERRGGENQAEKEECVHTELGVFP